MKSLIHISFLFLVYFPGFGQDIAIINDKDGYTNVRENTSTQSKIIGKKIENDVFYCIISKDSDWYEVSLESGTMGYIHKSRITPLSSLQKLNNKKANWRDEQLTIKNDTLMFQIQLRKFDSTKHQIKRGEKNYPITIDNHEMHGTFGNLPKVEISFIKLFIRSKEIVLPKEQLSDCYEIDLSRLALYADKKGRLFIFTSNSDGAGGYEAIWIIKNNKFQKREILVL
jgi:hypothetical protein